MYRYFPDGGSINRLLPACLCFDFGTVFNWYNVDMVWDV